MKVLLGIPTSGRIQLVRKAVESAFQQIRPPDEVQIVEEPGVAEPFFWSGQGKVQIIRNQEIGGPMVARNQMMLHTDAEVFVGLDDDSHFLDPDVIAKTVEIFKTQPRIGVLSYEILMEGDEQPRPRADIQQVSTFVGCGCALRVAAVKEVGGYEKLPGLYYGEESDLSLRLLDAGWETWKMPGYHVWHSRSHQNRPKKLRYNERMWGTLNDLTRILRRCPGLQLPVYLLANLIHQTRFALQNPAERLQPTLEGIGKFFLRFIELAASRRRVKSKTWKIYRRI